MDPTAGNHLFYGDNLDVLRDRRAFPDAFVPVFDMPNAQKKTIKVSGVLRTAVTYAVPSGSGVATVATSREPSGDSANPPTPQYRSQISSRGSSAREAGVSRPFTHSAAWR